MTILHVAFKTIREGEIPRKCRCGIPAVWVCKALISRETAYSLQPLRPATIRRVRSVCQTCRERIEGGAR